MGKSTNAANAFLALLSGWPVLPGPSRPVQPIKHRPPGQRQKRRRKLARRGGQHG